MAGSKLSLGVSIGGALDSSFGRTLSSAGRSLDALSNRSSRNRGLQSMIGDTLTLRRRMEELRQSGGNALRTLEAQHERNLARLKQHGVAVDRLEKEYQRLGKAARTAEFKEQGRAQIGRGLEQTKTGVQMGAAVGASLIAPTMIAAKYEATIRDIAIKGGIARTGDEKAMSESIRKDATANGMGRDELAEAVNTLVAGGMGWKEASGMAGLIAKFSVGQNAETTDVASLILALRQAGVKDADMQGTLGKVAVAGDLGSFESKDMAKWFASLMPNLTGFGMSGDKAAVALSAMLQTQMSAAGNTDEAANNLRNLFGKITADETRSKFKDKGIDYDGSMQAAITQGYDPVTAFLGLVEKSVAKTDPAKAKKMAELQERIAKTQDPAEAQKMLDGYLAMAGLSDFITDMQAKQAALAMLQNKKQHEQKLDQIRSTNGLTKLEQDLANRREASGRKWIEAGNAVNESMARFGDTLMPLTNQVADGIKSIATAGSELIQEYPRVLTGLVAVGGTIAALATARGAANLIGGATKFAFGGLGGLLGLGKDKGTASEPPSGLGGMAEQALSSTGVQPVFVTNWPSSGLDWPTGDGNSASEAGRAPKGKALSRLERVGLMGGKLGGALALGTAAYQAYDTYQNAQTDTEKAEGYGGAAGGLAGGLAGAKLGATIGAMAGPIGVGVGGLIGGALGSLGGDMLGEWLGREFVAPEPDQPTAQANLPAEAETPPAPTGMGLIPNLLGETISTWRERLLPESLSLETVGSTLKELAPELALPLGAAVLQSFSAWQERRSEANPNRRTLTEEAIGQNQRRLGRKARRKANDQEEQDSPDHSEWLEKLKESVLGDNEQESAEPTPPQVTAPQNLTFAPQLNITVQGDVKDPSQLASELMPHLQRLFADYQAAAARTELFEPAHV